MEPAIKTGSIVVDKSFPSYNIGDVVTYHNREDNAQTITHRLVTETVSGGITQMTTRGDANGVSDAISITPDLIIGKVMFSIPYLGFLVGFTRTTPGFIVLIIIPVTLIVYEEIRKIHHETKQIVKRRKEKKSIPTEPSNRIFSDTDNTATEVGKTDDPLNKELK
jgi:signal peptidase